MNFCPICGEPVSGQDSASPGIPGIGRSSSRRQPLSAFQKLTAGQKRKLVWEIIGIILLSGVFIPMIIDFSVHSYISWSRYPAAFCLALFINVTLVTFWHHRLLLLLSGSFLVSAGLLIFLDRYSGEPGWGIDLGIPLLLAAYLVLFALIFIIRRMKQYGLNLIAFILLAAGLLSICVEGIVSVYAWNHLRLVWSMIVMVSIIPVTAFLFLVHVRLKRGIDLKRFFHI